MPKVQLHKCRFMDYTRPYVSAMAFNLPSPGPKTPAHPDLRLAVGRSNGDIELWRPGPNWSLDTTFLGAKDRSIEDLAWSVGDEMRLFSVAASEYITEWDLATGQPLEHHSSNAGVIWAIETSPDGKKLAVACETGVVVIFDVSGGRGNLQFLRRLQSADTSLASLAWKSDNQVVAGGSDARLRVWDISTGRIIATMKVDKSKSMDGTVVWAVKTLRKGEQIVSGDSNGYIKIWDSKTLSLQQSFQAHPTDILSLACDSAGETLFSSGLDQKIVCAKMTDPKRKRWTIMSSRVAHSHDIRSMTIFEARGASYLVSGGLESTIVVNSVTQFDDKPFRKIPLTRYSPTVEINSSQHILEWCEQVVNIWGLYDGKKRLLATFNLTGEDEFISSASLEGNILVVATMSTIKFFYLEGLEDEEQVKSISRLNTTAVSGGARIIKFVGPESVLIITPDNEMDIYRIKKDIITEVEQPSKPRVAGSSKIPYIDGVALLAVSPDRKHFAVAKHSGYIEVYNTAKAAHVASLPSLGSALTAMAFRDNRSLVAVTDETTVYEFDVKSASLTSWSKEHSSRLPTRLSKQTTACCGVFPESDKSSRLWLWGPNWLAYLDFATKTPYRHANKRKQHAPGGDDLEDEDGPEDQDSPTFWMTHKFRPIFYAGAFDNGLLVSERPAMKESEAKPFWSNRHIVL